MVWRSTAWGWPSCWKAAARRMHAGGMPCVRLRRLSLLVPLVLAAVWGFGLMAIRGRYGPSDDLLVVADVWTRYSLAIPASLLASAGLVAQRRRFRQAGFAQFGRGCLWAAGAFGLHGLRGPRLAHHRA